MLTFLRAPDERRLVYAGRVSCPLRNGDAEVDECMQCGFARDVDTQAQAPFVRCRPPRRLLLLP